jgi:hypothetical protein
MFQLRPLLVTTDLSPSMIGPVRQIFGEEVLPIDGFHVMQELNRGIRRDVLDFRRREFQARIRELAALRQWLSQIQDQLQDPNQALTRLVKQEPQADLTHPDIEESMTITQTFLPLVTITDPQTFSSQLHHTLKQMSADSRDIIQTLVETITNHLPKRRLTQKGMVRLKIKLLRRLKKGYLEARTKLEATSTQFYKDHWLIFFQPERLTKERTTRLTEFLTRYPQLREYHQMTLQVGAIYRKPIESIDGQEITSLEIKPYYSEQLQTAIKTLKKFQRAILRFKDVFQANPSLAYACRANMEYYNRHFKAPFQHGLNCTKQEHLLAKLKLQLGCEVRFFVEEKKKKGKHKKLNA